MKKAPFYKNLWFWLILIGIITLIGNISVLIFVKSENQSAWLTLISGWISGIATLIVGIIAFKQNKQYKQETDEKERFVDVVIENVKVVTHLLPADVLGRTCVPKNDALFGHYRFLVTLFAFQENPIFDVRIAKALKDNQLLVEYDSIQPMRKGTYGRTFLTKNEFIQLTAEIPATDNYNGQYTLTVLFKNHYGDLFQKEIFVTLRNNFVGKVAKMTQGKTHLIQQEK